MSNVRCALDQSRPRCSRCHKANFECLGYREPFIDGGEQVMRRVHRADQKLGLSRSLALSACKSDIVISYLAVNITGPIATVCQLIAGPTSLQRTVIKECILALATTFFGIGHAQKSLVADGRRLYGRALNMISSTIKDPSHFGAEMMCAVFALSLHEVNWSLFYPLTPPPIFY